jgi:asparagine synthase (glutamine-hydrolysing)
MYAVATWRARTRSLVLARDPAGEKPLYVVRHPGWIAFASELQALVSVGLLKPEIEPDAVAMFLRLGHVPEPLSIYKKARPLAAGTILEIFPDGRERIQSWWPRADSDQPEISITTIRNAVIDAVSKSTISDVPAGVFLSGGVDSSIVAAAAHAAGCNLTAFTVSTGNGNGDEAGDAAATSRYLGIPHEVVIVGSEEARSYLPEFIRAMDQPTVDGFNSYLVSKAAHAAGLIVALSGVGGDELFRGYSTFAKMERARWLRRVPAREAIFFWAASADRRHHGRIVDTLRARDDLEAYVAVRGVLGTDRTERLLGGTPDWDRIFNVLGPSTSATGDQATSLLEITRYMRNQLLRDLDVFAMACSLEVRAPLLSPKLIALASALPNERKLRNKRILKDAFRADLPPGLLDRPKRSFSLPWEIWLRTSLRQTTLDVLHDVAGIQHLVDPVEAVALYTDFEAARLHWSGVWVVAALCQWNAAHKVNGSFSRVVPGASI